MPCPKYVQTRVRHLSSSSSAVSTPFAASLKQSRLIALPQSVKPVGRSTESMAESNRKYAKKQISTVPSDQIITTTPASYYKQDWGLKRPLPKRAPKNIVLKDIDFNAGLTNYDFGDKFALILNRIKESGTTVSPVIGQLRAGNRSTGGNGLFHTIQNHKSPQPIKSFESVNHESRDSPTDRNLQAFISFLESKGYQKPRIDTILESNPQIIESMDKEIKTSSRTSHIKLAPSQHSGSNQIDDLVRAPIATAGLLYLLPGSIDNRPPTTKSIKNITSAHYFKSTHINGGAIVPGRLVGQGDLATVGGVTGTVSLGNADRTIISNQSIMHEKVHPFTVRHISLTKNASLDMVVEYVSDIQELHGSQRRKTALLSTRRISQMKKAEEDLLSL